MRDPSFEEFVRTQLPTLGRHACALAGDPQAAEDLVVGTLATLARWSRHTPLDELRPLSMGTLYRTYVRGGVLPGRAGEVLTRAGGVLRRAVVGRSGTGTPFQRAVAALPRDQRAVLVGTYVAQASDVEIAELIGRTPVAVRSLRYRGLRTLRGAQGPAERTTSREAWVDRDTWTQETVHLPAPMPLPDSSRPATPKPATRAVGPVGPSPATVTTAAKRAAAGKRAVSPTPTRTPNAPRAVNPARGANSARNVNVGRAARAANKAGEVRHGGR
ncbi:hypothetical protein GCM10009682_43520 [Luedemannella flava]|uniref:RNA polymerase sigma factor 70 region 4 type 2 domain-containing protein n=1 Tax=Luedemannella flava TaxID=349316 RepID=A0ABP4YKT2_9ACTN